MEAFSSCGFLLHHPEDFIWMFHAADGDVTICFLYVLELHVSEITKMFGSLLVFYYCRLLTVELLGENPLNRVLL